MGHNSATQSRLLHLPTAMSVHQEGPLLAVSKVALRDIAKEAARSLDGLETGGILLGVDTGERLELRHAGGPGPGARRGKRYFLRDLAHAQRLAEAVWALDGSQWIGEWHTHPSGTPQPSRLDMDSYRRHLRDPDLNLDRFVSMIVVLDSHANPTFATWLVQCHEARPIQLTEFI